MRIACKLLAHFIAILSSEIKMQEKAMYKHTEKTIIRSALAVAVILILQGCGGSSSSSTQSTQTNTDTGTDNTNTDNSGNTDSGNGSTNVVNITDTVFDERSDDCSTYVNSYEADVTDITVGTGFIADIVITANDDSCTLVSNGIPNHNFNDTSAHFANDVSTQSISVSISRSPQQATTPTGLTQQVNNGIMLNGVVIDLLSAGCYDPSSPQASDGSQGDDEGITPIGCQDSHPWLADPLGIFHRFGADSHNAHTQPGGLYHYHGNPNAMFDDNPGDQGSPVIGFAADGFPIYGSYFLDETTGAVREAKSGYTLKTNRETVSGYDTPPGIPDGKYINDWEFTNAGDLDECNGMTVNGQYGYYVINEFPWIINCYKGTPDPSFYK